MDSLKKAFTQSSDTNTEQPSGGMMDTITSSMGGGPASEKNEGVDFVQQRMGGGQQTDESVVEQAKDECISDAIRSKYKSATGREFPVADK